MASGVSSSRLPITTLASLLPGPLRAMPLWPPENSSVSSPRFFLTSLQSVLIDNGSEFMKHFDEEIRSLHKNHWHTYPKHQKSTAMWKDLIARFKKNSLITMRSCLSPLTTSIANRSRGSSGTTLKDLIWHCT
jgi:hypothetical protein